MMLYASEEKRAELAGFAGNPVPLKLASAMMPRVYTVRALATSPDTSRARMRATGSFTFMGSTAPSYGVIDLVREPGGWKVAKFEWTGDKPAGWDEAVAQSAVRRSASGTLEKVQPKPPPEEKPSPVASEIEVLPTEPATPAPRSRAPCEIKPVMTDEDLLNCGASPR